MPKMQFDLNDNFEVNPLSVCQDVIQDELLCKLPKGAILVSVKIDYDQDIMTVVYRYPEIYNVIHLTHEIHLNQIAA